MDGRAVTHLPPPPRRSPAHRDRGIWAAGEELGAAVMAWRRDRRAAGLRLRAAREAAGLSQLDLAAATGVAHETLSRLELGGRSPTTRTLAALARALGAAPATLAAGEPAEEWLTAREAAAVLGVDERAVRRRIDWGWLPAEKVAGRWRIPAAAVGGLRPEARRRWPPRR